MFGCIGFRHVEQIDRRHSGVQRFPEDAFRHHRKLKSLLLDGNNIKQVPKNVSTLSKLERLSLADNELTGVPADIFRLGRLQELIIKSNGIKEIPADIKTNTSLLILDISSNAINSVPDSIVEFTHLTSLCMNDCSLQRLPQELSGLKCLQILEARDNHLKYLPQTISQLKQLRKLDVGCNDITDLPEGIGNLTLLEELWVDTNDMESLPVEIGALEQLKVADFSENHLESLPSDLRGLLSLQDLLLSTNTLLTLPDSIGSLKSLTQLKCENNHLTQLPDTIGNLATLRELFLTDNMLESLPSSLGKLKSLSTLYVDRNHLVSVPPELCLCKSLSILSFRQNSITRIPPDYGMMASLKVVDLCNNKLENLPYSFLQLELKALWLSDNQSKPLIDLQEDSDPVTKEALLTCVLLPQAIGQSQSLENLLQVGTAGSSLMDPDATSRASQVTGSSHDRNTRVAFAPETLERTGETESENQVKLQRHPTPFAKDMRAKAKKLRSIDGRKSPEGSKRSSTGSLVPSEAAATPPIARAEEDTTTKTESTTRGVAFADDTKDKPDGAAGSRFTSASRRDTPHPSTLLKDATPATGSAAAAAAAGKAEEGILDNNADEENAIPAQVTFDEQRSNGDKHVSFGQGPDVDEEEEGDVIGSLDQTAVAAGQSKLLRKDTPKPKPYSGTDESKLRRRDTPRSFGTPSFGKASPGTAVLEEDEEEEEAEAEMSRLAEESAAKAREVPEPAVAYKDFEVVMIRKDGCSLGISISGGVDCNPRYRADNDHVYVTKVNPGGLADKAGDIQPGDQIIAVNDTDYTGGISHEQAVSVLKATDGTVKFVLRREVYTDESAPVTINVIPAVVEKDNDEDDLERRTDTPPTPEETKRNLVALPEERTLVEGMEMVTINRGEEALGMTIVGGSDTSPLPFGSQAPDDKGVYISKIVPDGLVASSGQLRVGDQIISVNDSELTGTQHSTAVACLVGTSVLKLIVRHVGPPPGIMEVVFAKAPEEKLGMSIRGGSGAAKSGNPFDDRDEGIFISKINPGGAAHRSGKFRQGQRILEVNGNTLLGATHHEAVHVLKSIGQTVKFVVCDGYEPPESELQSLDASLVSQVSAVSQAVPASTGTTEPLSNASSQPLTPPSEPVSPPEEAVSQPTEAVSLPTDTVSQPAESSAAVPEQVGSVEASTEVVAAPETAEPTRTTPEVIVSSPSEDRGDEQDILAEKPRTTSWADEVEATEAAATEAAAAEVASTEAAAAASENTVEVGGHALRSTPVREARQKSGSESGAVSSPSHSTATPDSLDAGENDGEGAAASPSSSSSSASKAKKKKHKKHKKRHAEEGEGAEGKEHRHRRKQRKDGDAAAGGGNA